jgi:hypothetical protein
MSVFETIAVCGGRPLLMEAHLERLGRAARDCGFAGAPWPSDFSDFNFAPLETGLLRFYLTAGEGGLESPFAGEAYALFDAAKVG